MQIQTLSAPAPLKSGHIQLKDGHSAESNERSFFRFFQFIFFKIRLVVFTVTHVVFIGNLRLDHFYSSTLLNPLFMWRVPFSNKIISYSKVAQFLGKVRIAQKQFFGSWIFFCAIFSF